MLPFSATFTGHRAQAEAPYEGSAGNPVGVTTFAGSRGNETPQHAVLLGLSGAGKSVTVCDLPSQTEAFYDCAVNLEEGLSYAGSTRTVEPGAHPIIIQPDGDLTINYLDTHGLPLTAEHLASATALVATIVGVSRDEDRQLSRETQIANYVAQLYDDVFEEWSRRNSGRLMEIARHACTLARLHRGSPGSTGIDAFVDFRPALATLEKLAARGHVCADYEASERRHGLRRGTLVVLGVVPESGVPGFEERRAMPEEILPSDPVFAGETTRSVSGNDVCSTPNLRVQDDGDALAFCARLCEANRVLRCDFFDGFVMTRADSIYPVQRRSATEEFRGWEKTPLDVTTNRFSPRRGCGARCPRRSGTAPATRCRPQRHPAPHSDNERPDTRG